MSSYDPKKEKEIADDIAAMLRKMEDSKTDMKKADDKKPADEKVANK